MYIEAEYPKVNSIYLCEARTNIVDVMNQTAYKSL